MRRSGKVEKYEVRLLVFSLPHSSVSQTGDSRASARLQLSFRSLVRLLTMLRFRRADSSWLSFVTASSAFRPVLALLTVPTHSHTVSTHLSSSLRLPVSSSPAPITSSSTRNVAMASPAPPDPAANSPPSLLDLPNELIERVASMIVVVHRFTEEELEKLSENGKALQGLRGACKRTAAICRGVAFQVRSAFSPVPLLNVLQQVSCATIAQQGVC